MRRGKYDRLQNYQPCSRFMYMRGGFYRGVKGRFWVYQMNNLLSIEEGTRLRYAVRGEDRRRINDWVLLFPYERRPRVYRMPDNRPPKELRVARPAPVDCIMKMAA